LYYNIKFGDNCRNSSEIKDYLSSVDIADGRDALYTVEMGSSGMTYTKFHDSQFRHSSNIKITSTMGGCSVCITDGRGL
jgi:hypothetical protein